jgi:hypothetical protein
MPNQKFVCTNWVILKQKIINGMALLQRTSLQSRRNPGQNYVSMFCAQLMPVLGLQ